MEIRLFEQVFLTRGVSEAFAASRFLAFASGYDSRESDAVQLGKWFPDGSLRGTAHRRTVTDAPCVRIA